MPTTLTERWRHASAQGFVQWYGNVDYYGPYVIGQWLVLDRETGAKLWQHSHLRANTICDCAHDVIIASETRSDGPWTADFGIYGICARTGRLLWTSHGRGLWGRFVRLLDYVPAFTNELRDSPKYIIGETLVTRRGRVLDLHTGLAIANPPPSLEPEAAEASAAFALYSTKRVRIKEGTLIVTPDSEHFSFHRLDDEDREIWRHVISGPNLFLDGNYYSYRYSPELACIFIIIRSGPAYVPLKAAKPRYVRPNSADCHLRILDIENGHSSQIPLGPANQCRIEALNNDRILISLDGQTLVEYQYTPDSHAVRGEESP